MGRQGEVRMMTQMRSVVCAWAMAALVLGQVASGGEAKAPLPPRPEENQEQFAYLQSLIDAAKKQRQPHIAAQAFCREATILETDRDPVDVVLRRTMALIAHLKGMEKAPNLAADEAALKQLGQRGGAIGIQEREARLKLFEEAVTLRRKVALANPLLDFDKILFIKRHYLPPHYGLGEHMCDQYFGFHAIRGGGLFVLEKPFSATPTARNVLADSVCENGRFQGKKLDAGGFLSPELSFDGKSILFAYTEAEPTRYKWTEKSTFHLFRVSVDGSGLRQLTDGAWNDFDPCWLPNGRIAFISERRGGYGRCHGRPVPTYTLHTMNPDGSDIVCISPHETNEWQPSVGHDGMILYTRWDYVDRGFSQAHHPWIITPDGCDARAIQGNYGKSFGARPLMEMQVRAIPGSHRLVATATPHHGQAYGSLVIVDPRVGDDDAMGPVRRLTPEQRFPESEFNADWGRGCEGQFSTPWPLSEHFYLCVYDVTANADGQKVDHNRVRHGIYLVDAFGNKELLYRDRDISCLSPRPLRATPVPPVVPAMATFAGPAEGKTAPVAVLNVYDSASPWPKGTVIKALRIVQVLPKSTPSADVPPIGFGSQKNARAVLGTVPVESDGSAHFLLPVSKPVFFQAVDEKGLAVQSMRSDTWVHPGQRLTCRGCHERRPTAPQLPTRSPLALGRPPSAIQPDVEGSNPFSFPRLVQPVLDRHCAECHAKNPKSPDLRVGEWRKNPGYWYTSYKNLRNYAFFYSDPSWVAPRTIPGQFGARASRLYAILQKGHYDVKLPPEDLHRITLWLDCSSDFFGAYENTEAQARGEIVRPTLE